MILQYLYKPVLNFIYEKITFRIPDKFRYVGILISFLMIFCAQFFSQYIFQFEGFNRGIRDYLICLLLGIIILLSVDRRLEIVKWKLTVYIPFVLTGLLLFAASLDHEMGPAYQAFPLTMLVGFICLFFVWGNTHEYKKMFISAASAYLIFIMAVFIWCVLKYPYIESENSLVDLGYSAFGINPNGMAKLFLPGVVCGVFLMMEYIYKKRCALFALCGGFCSGVVFLTQCRAGELCLVIIALIFIVSVILKHKQIYRDGKKVRLMYVSIVILAVGMIIGVLMIGTIGSKIGIEGIVGETAIGKEENLQNNGSGNTDEESQKNLERQEMINQRLSESKSEIYGNETLQKIDILTAGRIAIWNIYFDNMTWRGNSELMFYDTEYAHNQYIELSYKAGYPTGILYLLTVLIAGWYICVTFFKSKGRAEEMFKLMVWTVFFVISMFDTGILPFERGFIFLFYIVLADVFMNKRYI